MALSSRKLHWYQTYVWEWWHAIVLGVSLLALFGIFRGVVSLFSMGQRVHAVAAAVDGALIVISAQANGRVTSLKVEVGDPVKEHQVIAELDDRELRSAVREAEAALVAARSQVAQAEASLDLGRAKSEGEVAQAQAAVAAAEVGLRQARTQTQFQTAQQREQVRQAEAALRAATAGLKKAQEGPLKQEIELARAGLAAAQARLSAAKSRMERAQRLLAQGFVPDLQVEQAKTGLEVAEADHRAALEKLSLLEAGTRKEDIEAATQNVAAAQAALALAMVGRFQTVLKKEEVARQEAEVRRVRASLTSALSAYEEQVLRRQELAAARAEAEKAEANLATARVALGEAVLKSPSDGVIVEVPVHEGESLAVNQPVARLVSSKRYWITATLPETEIRKIRVGQKARIELEAFPDRKFSGTVQVIGSSTAAISWPFQSREKNPQGELTQEVPVRIELDYGRTPLKPGMSAKVTILLNEQ